MDLGAYAQIPDLDKIAKANGIEIPRLRGYRLMSEEQSISGEEVAESMREYELFVCERALRTVPRFCPDSNMTEISPRTRKLERKYLVRKTEVRHRGDGSEYLWNETVAFRWDLLHGKRRKNLKFAIKKGREDVTKQFKIFNKYAGRNDVLYIHARIGGGNWLFFGGDEIAKQPWFLEKVDDYFDSTYCDIYALINRNGCERSVKDGEDT